MSISWGVRPLSLWFWIGLALGLWACGDGAGFSGGDAEDISVPDEDIRVETPDGQGEEGDGEGAAGGDAERDTEDEEDGLRLWSVSPEHGSVIGLEQVTIYGQGFGPEMQVFFGEALAQDITVLDEERLVVLSPPQRQARVDVVVRDLQKDREARLPKAYQYRTPVVVEGLSPDRGDLAGGTWVEIRGSGFTDDAVVLIGGRRALETRYRDDTRLEAQVPAAESPGYQTVWVWTSQGTGEKQRGFYYRGAPTVDWVRPAFGPTEGGQQVQVSGQLWDAGLRLWWGTQVFEGWEDAAEGQVTLTTPPHPAGPVAIRVDTEDGTEIREGAYIYVEEEDAARFGLHGLSPAQGPVEGGQIVDLIATGLNPTADIQVHFDGREAEIVEVDVGGGRVRVKTPAMDQARVVFVRLRQGGRTSLLEAAYRYVVEPTVLGLTPGRGPATGGTAIRVHGRGFHEGMGLQIGALEATGLRILDDATLEAITPAGSPGLAPLSLLSGGRRYPTEAGFTYEGPLALWVADPAYGAIAGGTYVTLYGSGFEEGVTVQFNGEEAREVTVHSGVKLSCKTPPGEVGYAEIVVRHPQGGTANLPFGFTYFDPATTGGGTSGGRVEGAVNVTVLNQMNRRAIADAYVILGTRTDTGYQGLTDARGQITFSEPGLAGEQVVTAAKRGFSSASVVAYDAANVTLFLRPVSDFEMDDDDDDDGDGSGQDSEPFEPAWIEGRLLNLDKSFPKPLGRCADLGPTGGLCQACAQDEECGAELRCSTLPEQSVTGASGRYCTQDCQSSADCPATYVCAPLDPSAPPQCVPDRGSVAAYCNITASGLFGAAVKGEPGVPVDADGYFSMDTSYTNGSGRQRFGDMAVYCYAGVREYHSGRFLPLVMGVARHLSVYPGSQHVLNIRMEHPLDRRQKVELGPIPRGDEGPWLDAVFPYIDLGGDGVIPIPVYSQVLAGTEPIMLERFFSGLRGELYDARFAFLAGSYSLMGGEPMSLTQKKRIRHLQNDVLFLRQDGEWEAYASGLSRDIHAFFSRDERLNAVGNGGLVLYDQGEGWVIDHAQTEAHLRAIHGATGPGAETLMAVGDLGTVIRHDGQSWTRLPSPTGADLRDVWMLSDEIGWAVGAYAGLYWDGESWTQDETLSAYNLYAIYGFAEDLVWAAGAGGLLLRYDGEQWLPVAGPTALGVRAIWGEGPGDLWFIGEGGLVMHFDGQGFEIQADAGALAAGRTLHDIYGDAEGQLWVVGQRGALLQYDGVRWGTFSPHALADELDVLAVGGRGVPLGGQNDMVVAGANELVLGPILAVPEKLIPADGQVLGDEGVIRWETQPGPDPHFTYVEIIALTIMGWVTEWTMMVGPEVQEIPLPPLVEGAGLGEGTKVLSVIRVYKEGFDINQHANSDLNQSGWRSWSVNSTFFIVP